MILADTLERHVHHPLRAASRLIDQMLAHQQTQAEAAGYTFDLVIARSWCVRRSPSRCKRSPGGPPAVRRAPRWRHPGRALGGSPGRNYARCVRHDPRVHAARRRGADDHQRHGVRRRRLKDPIQQAVRDALIGFMAATAQAQAEATKRGTEGRASSTPEPPKARPSTAGASPACMQRAVFSCPRHAGERHGCERD